MAMIIESSIRSSDGLNNSIILIESCLNINGASVDVVDIRGVGIRSRLVKNGISNSIGGFRVVKSSLKNV
jgi:hypothetical protein